MEYLDILLGIVYSPDKKAIHKILFFLSGPMFNFVFAILLIPIGIRNLVYTNFILGIINLLPIFPLDGGNILKSILEQNFGLIKSFKLTLMISKIILCIITVLYSFAILKIKNIWIFIAILYLWYIYFLEKRNLIIYLKVKSNVKKHLSVSSKAMSQKDL